MVTVADVLSEESLALTLSVGEPAALDREVRWVAVTELDDPGRFLSGGELVLTTGLRRRGGRAQEGFVRGVAAAGAVALGFGTGLTHAAVPGGIRRTAADCGLPVIEVPYRTPFLAVDHFVADRVLAQQYGRSQALLQAYDDLAVSVLSQDRLDGLVARLRSTLRTPVVVLDDSGAVIAGPKRSAGWAADMVRRRHHGALAVELQGEVVAHLCARSPLRMEDVLPYAVRLVALELSRRRAVLEGQRLLMADLLVDVVQGMIPAPEARKRLGRFGIDLDATQVVVMGSIPGMTAERIRRTADGPVRHPGAVSAWVEGTLVLIVPREMADGAADRLAAHLHRAGGQAAVGVGAARSGLAGLRWSYHEAGQAMARGPGVHAAAGLSMAGLIVTGGDLPVHDLAAEALAPLVTFDEANRSALVPTLRTYLDLDGSVARVAERMTVHRNTVRYRLAQVTVVTGRGVDSTADRLHWYLALLAVDLAGGPR